MHLASIVSFVIVLQVFHTTPKRVLTHVSMLWSKPGIGLRRGPRGKSGVLFSSRSGP